jgi:hypothetical protein
VVVFHLYTSKSHFILEYWGASHEQDDRNRERYNRETIQRKQYNLVYNGEQRQDTWDTTPPLYLKTGYGQQDQGRCADDDPDSCEHHDERSLCAHGEYSIARENTAKTV